MQFLFYQNLKTLDLQENKLSELDCIDMLTGLTFLNVSKNPFLKLTKSMVRSLKAQKSLKDFNVDTEKLTCEILSHLPNIKRINRQP